MKVPGIRLSNGHTLKYVAAAGALGDDGRGYLWDRILILLRLLDKRLFTTVLKTATLPLRAGNFDPWHPWRCISFLPDGVVNAFGLTNSGCKSTYRKISVVLDSEKMSLIGSIMGEIEELIAMMPMMNDLGLVGLEIDVSCPSVGADILRNSERIVRSCEAVRSKSRHPVGVKLSVAHDIDWIVPRLRGLVEWIAINSVPWEIVYPVRISPLAHLGGGGVSGKAAQKHTWWLIEKLVAMTDIPVIGPSVWDYPDINTILGFGAKAVSFGALFMPNPYRPLNPLRPTAFVRRHMRENAQGGNG